MGYMLRITEMRIESEWVFPIVDTILNVSNTEFSLLFKNVGYQSSFAAPSYTHSRWETQNLVKVIVEHALYMNIVTEQVLSFTSEMSCFHLSR